MAQTTKKIYSDLFLKIVDHALITLGEDQVSQKSNGIQVFNRNWEGEVQRSGATTVNIPVEGADPTIRNYVIASGIDPQVVQADNFAVVISGDHGINELIDGYEEHTIPAKVAANRLKRAAVAFAKKIDKDGITTLEASTTVIKAGGAITKADAFEKFLDARTKGYNDGVSFDGVILSPKFFQAIKLDPAFTKPSDLGMRQAKNGIVGFIDGIPAVVAQTGANGLDAKTEFILIDSAHATRIIAWKIAPKLVNLDGSSKYIGASAIKGRLIFKHQITNPKGISVTTNEA